MAIGITAVSGTSQNTIEQYYLGAFGPLEQIPPTIYRIIVRGQVSAISPRILVRVG